MARIDLQKKVLSKNDAIAESLKDIFRREKIFVINLISSPGSGKTSLLEKIIPLMKESFSCGVLEGDVQTENDAKRIEKLNIPVHQIITCGACHLDAQMVMEHIDMLPLKEIDLLFVENVGNLVCPSSYILGEDIKMVILSTAEGDDKPIKYPAIFRRASLMIINKMDLVKLTDFDLKKAINLARGINPSIEVFPVSCRTSHGLDKLVKHISKLAKSKIES